MNESPVPSEAPPASTQSSEAHNALVGLSDDRSVEGSETAQFGFWATFRLLRVPAPLTK